MSRPALELADIVRRYGPAYRQAHPLPCYQRALLRAIEICRTARLGGHVEQCDHCSHQRISYNSCRNRHCPKCQSLARAQWLEQRKAELLPVEYFHVVFTVPEQIAAIAFYNKKLVYSILFRTAAETLLTIAGDPRHLGARIGFFAILHTWGQNLLHHPHLHCVVPGGGFSGDHQRWIGCRPGFFLPVRVLSRLFRRLFLKALRKAHQKGQLKFFPDLAPLHDAGAFARYLDPLRQLEWVVYAKPPFGGPHQVLEYLGRYTHRVAIANERLIANDNDQVSFRWKDYRHRDRHQWKTMTLAAEEFLRRFLLHALPPGFQRIRYFGWLANRHRKRHLQQARQLLGATVTEWLPEAAAKTLALITGTLRRCPQCGIGILIRTRLLEPGCLTTPAYLDSS
jgi:hypothetical protein